MVNKTQHKIAIFASGSGTNAQEIINRFKNNSAIKVELIVCNKADAFVLERAKNENIPSVLISKSDLKTEGKLAPILQSHDITFIVLAGFLLQIPEWLIQLYPNKIINIHPALLPKYGGKGMYGNHVHEAVVANKETESGITIHFVNENYDEGKIIFQAKCTVESIDTAASVAEKIHQLEHKYFPAVIENLLTEKL